jgi:hypothetical protein
MYRLQDFWERLLETVGIRKGVGSLTPETWPEVLYLSAVTISCTFQTTLKTILSTVCFRTAISVHVFSTLKHTLRTMSVEDSVYCLMFNEMSIRDNVHFNQKFGCIEGFEGLGSHGRTNNIANHALVFMHCSLYKKWKQPVSYYLIHGSAKGEMPVNFLIEVLDTCYDAGL